VFIASLGDWNAVGDIASNFATALAVIGGGLWAYWRFARERTRWPLAEVELHFEERRLDEELIFLNVRVRVKNAGRGLMQLTRLRVDLRQVFPLDAETSRRISAEEQYGKNGVETRWPLIKKHERKWASGKGELEPGETEEFRFDFFLGPTIEVVRVYAFLANVKKKRGTRPLGWGQTEFHEIALANP